MGVCLCVCLTSICVFHTASLQVDFAGIDVDFEYGKGPFSDCIPVSNML